MPDPYEQYMSPMEKARLRAERKVAVDFDPVVVTTLSGLKAALNTIAPSTSSSQEITLSAEIDAVIDDESGGLKKQRMRVSAPTRSKSKRDILRDGFEAVKRRLDVSRQINQDIPSYATEVNGVEITPAKRDEESVGTTWVDPLIRQWLGGKREGLFIVWDIEGARYKYDFFEHKLTKVTPSAEPTS